MYFSKSHQKQNTLEYERYELKKLKYGMKISSCEEIE